MNKTIICQGKEYEFDARKTQKEFFDDLIETMDWAFYDYLSQTIYWRENQDFIKNHVLKALKEVHHLHNPGLKRLRTYFKGMAYVAVPPSFFLILYSFRRVLFKKYFMRLSEETAYRVMRNVITAYSKGKPQSSDSPLNEYLFPYIHNGELFFLKDRMDGGV